MWTQRLYCTVAQYSRSSNVRRRTAILQRIAVHIGLVSLSSRNELGDKRNAGHIKLQDNLDLREGRGSQTRRTRAPARPAFPPLPLGIGIMASKLLGARVWPIHVDQPNLNAVASDENRPTHARVNANPIPLRGCLCCCCCCHCHCHCCHRLTESFQKKCRTTTLPPQRGALLLQAPTTDKDEDRDNRRRRRLEGLDRHQADRLPLRLSVARCGTARGRL